MSMQSILAATQAMSSMQTIQSARTQMQGRANVLRIESKQDGGNEEKEAKADALEEKSSDLMNDLMNQADDVNQSLRPDEKVEAEEKLEQIQEEKLQEQKQDKVTLSDAAENRSVFSQTTPVVDQPVIYSQDGSKVSELVSPTEAVLDVMA